MCWFPPCLLLYLLPHTMSHKIHHIDMSALYTQVKGSSQDFSFSGLIIFAL